jgi:DNA-binding MarR family transcriptional regulator
VKGTDQVVGVVREWTETFMRKAMCGVVYVASRHGLSRSQVGALFQLSHRGASSVAHIGDRLGVTSAAASQMLDRLVQQGLIARSEDPNDRRAKQVTLTEEGRRFVEEAMGAWQRWFRSVAEEMSAKERETVVAGLRVLLENAGSVDPDIEPCGESEEGERTGETART